MYFDLVLFALPCVAMPCPASPCPAPCRHALPCIALPCVAMPRPAFVAPCSSWIAVPTTLHSSNAAAVSKGVVLLQSAPCHRSDIVQWLAALSISMPVCANYWTSSHVSCYPKTCQLADVEYFRFDNFLYAQSNAVNAHETLYASVFLSVSTWRRSQIPLNTALHTHQVKNFICMYTLAVLRFCSSTICAVNECFI